jgi:hypothetical protein
MKISNIFLQTFYGIRPSNQRSDAPFIMKNLPENIAKLLRHIT